MNASSPDSPSRQPRVHYEKQGDEAARTAKDLERRLLVLSRLRMGAFFLTVGPLLFLETTSRDAWLPLIGLAAVASVAFVTLVMRHRKASAHLRRAQLLQQICREGEARLERRWSDLPPCPIANAPPHHPSAADLDLVGKASLARLLGRVHTSPGRAVMRRLVLDPLAPLPRDARTLLGTAGEAAAGPSPDEAWYVALRERQEAVRALAPETGFRTTFELLARGVEGREDAAETRTFLEWADSPGRLEGLGGSLVLARILGVVTPLSLLGWIVGATPGLVPLAGSIVALGLHMRTGKAIHAGFDAAEAGEGALRRWSLLLKELEGAPEKSALLASMGSALRSPSPGGAEAIRKLMRITDTASVRRSSMAHFFLVALFAWDVHILAWLDRWHGRHAAAVSDWIRILGEAEALISLAGLAHDHPSWTFPDLDAEPQEGLEARSLGHPLLPPDRCVHNDVELPAPGNLLLVTGSNMAGKTTLLRAVGTNQVLALMGAPVAADEFRTRPIIPWTTMAVRDSLEEGVSFFLAELQRLRRVVDAAEQGPVLFLLDEILQGTNSAERRIAARIVLDRLLATKSIGAVTTHDLTLADTDELGDRSIDVHFREDVRTVDGRRTLSFDYLLRPGPATSRNALLLLDIVGLGSPGTDSAIGPGDLADAGAAPTARDDSGFREDRD
jgi:hypothetical protein